MTTLEYAPQAPQRRQWIVGVALCFLLVWATVDDFFYYRLVGYEQLAKLWGPFDWSRSTTTIVQDCTGRSRGLIFAALIAACLLRWVNHRAYVIGLGIAVICLALALASYSTLNLGMLVGAAAYPEANREGSWWRITEYAATAAMEIVLILGAGRLALHAKAAPDTSGRRCLAWYGLVFFSLLSVRGVYEIAMLVKFLEQWQQTGSARNLMMSKAARAPYFLVGLSSAVLWSYSLYGDRTPRTALRCAAWVLVLVGIADALTVMIRAGQGRESLYFYRLTTGGSHLWQQTLLTLDNGRGFVIAVFVLLCTYWGTSNIRSAEHRAVV